MKFLRQWVKLLFGVTAPEGMMKPWQSTSLRTETSGTYRHDPQSRLKVGEWGTWGESSRDAWRCKGRIGLIDEGMLYFLLLQSNCCKSKQDFLKMVGSNHSNLTFFIISITMDTKKQSLLKDLKSKHNSKPFLNIFLGFNKLMLQGLLWMQSLKLTI